MTVVPILHRDPKVRNAFRRVLHAMPARVVTCRSVTRIRRALDEELVAAVVVDVREPGADDVFELLGAYARIPFFAYSAFRPDDARLLAACRRRGFHGILVGGIDDPVAGEVVAARTAEASRRRALADAPRRLRLAAPLQLRAWDEVLRRVDRPTRTADVARALGVTREFLSREFQAGGGPNLKRAIDLARIACAAHLLENDGYRTGIVARILHFSSPSHFATTARRVAGVAPHALAQLGPRGVLDRFVAGRTRSHG